MSVGSRGSGGRSAPVVHNWPLKLARHRAGDAAVRGPRRVPGQQRVPGAGGRVRREPAAGHGRHQRPARHRADPVHRAARRRPACAPRTSRRPSTSPTSSPTAQQADVRVAVSAIDPRVTILDFAAALDPGRARRGDDQAGPGRRPAGADAADGVDVGDMTYTPQRVTVTGAVHGREPRRVGARIVARSTPRASTSTATSRRRPVDDSGRDRGGRGARPAHGPRDDPAVHQPPVADAAR